MSKKPSGAPNRRPLKDVKSSSGEPPSDAAADEEVSNAIDHASPRNAIKAERAFIMTGGDQALADRAMTLTIKDKRELQAALSVQGDNNQNAAALRKEWTALQNLGYGSDKKLYMGSTSRFLFMFRRLNNVYSYSNVKEP